MSYYSNKTRQQQIAIQQAWQAYMRMDPMNCIIDPQGSKGGLYLGNIDAAQNVEMLHRHNIGAVLTVAARTGLKYSKNQIQTHEIIHADDVETFDLSKYFPKLLDFIERNIANTNVLVHCFAGVSRSATTVIAYLMKTNNWSYEKSMFYCRSRRKVTNPNPGFVRQLLAFEKRLNNEKKNITNEINNRGVVDGNMSQSMFYQGGLQQTGPVRVLPASSHSNRNQSAVLQDPTPTKNGRNGLSSTMTSFKSSSNYLDQNTPLYPNNNPNNNYKSSMEKLAVLSNTLKSNYHEQTLQSAQNNNNYLNATRQSVKTGNNPLLNEYQQQQAHYRSQSQQSQRLQQDHSPHFGGSSKANQLDNKSQLLQTAYGQTFTKQSQINNDPKSMTSYNNNNYQYNDRMSAKERSSSQQPIYSQQQQVHQSGYDYQNKEKERNSSVRQSIFPPSSTTLNHNNQSHYQNQQNFSNSLRNNYQKAPSYVLSSQTPKTAYGSSYLNLNKLDSRPYQFLNSQVTPQSVYSSSYGIASKSVNYNPKYYPTRRALFSDRPLF